MNIFLETSYHQVLRQVVEERKAIDQKFNFQAIAEATRIPKSYLSKVAHEKAHFSPDQMYLVTEFLGMTELQARYMALLLEHARSGVKARREALEKELQAIRERALDSREHLQAKPESLSDQALKDYYLDPLHQVVHICLSIPRYQTDAARLAADLGISVQDLRVTIERLEGLGVIEHANGRYKTLVKGVHLPRTSPAYKPWRNQLKLLCLERLNHKSKAGDYSFSVCFSATDKVRDKIKADFLELLKKAEVSVRDARQDGAYQMSFELFAWTN